MTFKDLLYEYALDHPEFVEDHFDMYFCEKCDEFVTTHSETVSNSKGHIDNWLPDDTFTFCSNCDAELEA